MSLTSKIATERECMRTALSLFTDEISSRHTKFLLIVAKIAQIFQGCD